MKKMIREIKQIFGDPRLATPLFLGVVLWLVTTSPVAAQGPAQVALFKTLLPLFCAVAIPVFIFVTASKRDAKTLFSGVIIGVITYVVARFMVAVI